ncbi:4-hydroxy-3-methylbut-2-en-1-yl diphosphate synthase, partial [Streptomyces sp. LB8]|nr:4-hydroxy-3-methylbut-2-en-1-yl diphosphate synthase [Streptomyces sp. LB8]
IKTVPESKIVETLIEEAMKLAREMERGEDAPGGSAVVGAPTVTVSQ